MVPGPESRRLWRQVAVAGEAACLRKWGLARHSTGGSGRYRRPGLSQCDNPEGSGAWIPRMGDAGRVAVGEGRHLPETRRLAVLGAGENPARGQGGVRPGDRVAYPLHAAPHATAWASVRGLGTTLGDPSSWLRLGGGRNRGAADSSACKWGEERGATCTPIGEAGTLDARARVPHALPELRNLVGDGLPRLASVRCACRGKGDKPPPPGRPEVPTRPNAGRPGPGAQGGPPPH